LYWHICSNSVIFENYKKPFLYIYLRSHHTYQSVYTTHALLLLFTTVLFNRFVLFTRFPKQKNLLTSPSHWHTSICILHNTGKWHRLLSRYWSLGFLWYGLHARQTRSRWITAGEKCGLWRRHARKWTALRTVLREIQGFASFSREWVDSCLIYLQYFNLFFKNHHYLYIYIAYLVPTIEKSAGLQDKYRLIPWIPYSLSVHTYCIQQYMSKGLFDFKF